MEQEILTTEEALKYLRISKVTLLRLIHEAFPDYNPSIALRGARHKESLTQKELAKLIGISQHHISEMENGKRPIGKDMAKKLSKVLHIGYRVFL